MTIIGIDPSLTHSGWVLFDENKTGKDSVIQAGVFKTDKSDGLYATRLILQRERIKLLLSMHNIKFVAMEAPLFDEHSTEILYALHQFFHEVFLDLKVYLIYLQPSTVKKYAYPDMDPDEVTKHLMTHKALKELNLLGKRFSEHAADAYFIGKIGLKYYQWLFMKKYTDDQLLEMERNIFCGKHTYVKGIKKGLTEYNGIIYRENERFYDYTKQLKTSQIISKEIQDGGQEKSIEPFRIL